MGTVDADASYKPLPVDDEEQPQQSPHALEAELLSNPSAQPEPFPRERASWTYIYLLCVANFGISGAWALEFATVTPFFEAGLNAGEFVSHLVWIVGPLSGLIVAPIVGALSDTCTSSLGRRRPFIIAGMISTVLGMLTFSNAPQIAAIFAAKGSSVHHVVSCVVAVIAFCVLDLAINTTMWPVRALQADLLPHYEQHRVQSASVVIGSLGDLAANALVDSYEKPVSHIRSCYFLAALLYSSTVMVLLVLGKEKPLERVDDQAAESRSFNILNYLKSLPGWMWRIGGTYALGFFMLFCTMPNLSSWLGASVLGGDPNAPEGSDSEAVYERGVNIYGKASLIRALVQILFSAVYPFLLRFVSAGKLMGLCFGVYGILLAIFNGTKSLLIGQFMVIMLAFPEAAHFTLPTGLTVEYSDDTNRGKYLGALNCFAVIPQLIDTT
ncbi:MFS/sugar transport protein [Gracilaria domingensis]|nr:MFS/sugar transport protein [Gracilaria domingensis]